MPGDEGRGHCRRGTTVVSRLGVGHEFTAPKFELGAQDAQHGFAGEIAQQAVVIDHGKLVHPGFVHFLERGPKRVMEA
jgi:hypothetical protein